MGKKFLQIVLFNLFFLFAFVSAIGQTVTTISSSTTFTVPACVTSLKVEAWGGGGGGGGSSTSGAGTSCGGGGGGGAYSTQTFAVTPGQVYTITIGAGGLAAVAGNNAGGAGGTTTFTGPNPAVTVLCSATGGGGGGGAAANGSGAAGTAGNAGTGFAFAGGPGRAGAGSAGASGYAGGGGGGGGNNGAGAVGNATGGAGAGGAGSPNAAPYKGGNGGNNAAGNGNQGAGNPGSAAGPGGGGAGGQGYSAAQVGGAGAAGQVVLTYTATTPTITLGASPTICPGTTSASLPYTATTNSPDQYSITWSVAATGAGFANVATTALPASPISLVVPAGAPAAVYNGSITVTNSVTGCVSSSTAFTVTSTATSITLGANPTVCQGTTSANLPYSATAGSPNQYTITWNAAALAAGFANVATTVLPATPIVLTVPAAAPAAVYTGSVTVTNSGTGCSSSATAFTVTIGAALSGIKTVGTAGNYATLALAFADINAYGINGSLTLQVISNITDNTQAILNATPTCGPIGTLLVYPTGNYTLSGSNATSLITMNGFDNATFDGRLNGSGAANNLTISNTNTSGSTINFLADAGYITFQYCKIQGVETSATNGVIWFSTGTATGNDNILIDHCDIGPGASTPANCIYGLGTSAAVSNDNNTISNNNIHDFHLAANANIGGVVLSSGNSTWTITGNSFYQSATRTDGAYKVIYINNTSGNGFTITSNYIGGDSPLGAVSSQKFTDNASTANYAVYGIYMSVGTTTASSVQSNIIKNLSITVGASNTTNFAGIFIQAGNVDISSNTLGDNATGSIALNINAGISAAGNGTTVYGIYNIGKGSITSNTVGSITIGGTLTQLRQIFFIYSATVLTANVSISGNTIGHASTASSLQTTTTSPASFMMGILTVNSGAFQTLISNNVVANITEASTSSSNNNDLYGINESNSAGTCIMLGNSVHDLTTATTNSSTHHGSSILALIGVAGNTVPVETIANNTIYNLALTTTTSTPLLDGIWYGSTSASSVVSKNIIYNLGKTGAATAGRLMNGIDIEGGAGTISNNMIRLGYDNTGASITSEIYFCGILKNSNANCNFYFNTVYIGGTGVSTTTNQTTCFERLATGTDICKNNIFENTRANAGAGGNHYAIVTNSSTTFTSDYNDLYTSTAANVGSFNGGTTAQTFANWKATMGDANSMNVDAVLVSPTSATPDLHLQGTSPVIGQGLVAGGITDDIDNQTRATGVKASNTGPCIGADELCSGATASYAVYAPDGSAVVTDCEFYNSTSTCSRVCKVCTPADVSYTSVAVSGYPIIKSGDATNNYTNCTGVTMNMTAAAAPSWTSFGATSAPVSNGAAATVPMSYSTTGRKTIVTSGPYTYTEFNNMIMAAPSAGSITGATNVCPGTFNFASSVAGTPGFIYSWTVAPAGATIISANSSSTNITLPNATGANITYTVTCTVTSECCGVLPAVTYNSVIYPIPAAPTAAAAAPTPCVGGSVVLTATAPALASFNWYTASTGGVSLATNASYTVTPVVAGAATYYVETTNATGCVSSTRTPVTFTGTATTAPTVTGGSVCGSGNITISVSSPVAGYTYNFYTGSCGGTLVQSSTATVYTAFTAATTTYYISATAPGCAASTCNTASATIVAPPNPIYWLGVTPLAGTNNWFNTTNWTSGCLPTCASDVIINPIAGTIISQPDIGFNATAPAACKTINLNAGSILSFSDSKAELDVCGDFNHAGTLTTNNLGLVEFMGSAAAQTYTKSGSGNFNNVNLNNTFGTPTLTIATNDMILGTSGSFTFISGKVITTIGTNMLSITNPAPSSVSGHAAARYVQGRLRRYINSTGSYDFPVGSATKGYQNANVNFTSATTITYLSADFQLWSPLAGPLNVPECVSAFYNQNALDNGYWHIDANNTQNNSGVYNMTLYNTNYTNAASGWTVMSRHNGSATWALPNGDGSTGTCVPSPVTAVERDNMKGFSYFANAQSATILPSVMLNFTAAYNGKSVDLNWTTSSEINCNYFDVQRSTDGENFTSIKNVPSKAFNGNSNTQLSYYLNDPEVSTGIYYYRLKQYDINNSFKYSEIQMVTIEEENNVFNVRPNPTTSTVEITYLCYSSEDATVKVYDNRGRLVIVKDIQCTKGKNSASLDLGEHPDGMYFITLSTNNKVYKTKVIKHSN